MLLLTSRDKCINGIMTPRRHRGRYNRSNRWMKGPMVFRLLVRPFVQRRWAASANPGLQQSQLLGRQRSTFRRHSLRRIGSGHALPQATLLDFPWLDDWPIIATAQNRLDGIQSQATFLLRSTVATVTTLPQNRFHTLQVVR